MSHHDVIIVGARCAGAPLAALLAKTGRRVLLLDSDALPCDMPMSTHLIHPPGIDALDRLGVGDAVRACTPPTRRQRTQIERHAVYADHPQNRAAYCVRRSLLDRLLQDAATSAGTELRDRHRVVELLADKDGRIGGVVAETPQGRRTLRADLVVGADGRHSRVARMAGAETYWRFQLQRGGYFFYFPEPALWREDERYAGWDSLIEWRGDGLRYLFQCDGGLLLMVAAAPLAEAANWGADYRRRTLDYLAQSPLLAPLLKATAPIGKGVGVMRYESFYRRAYGPGYALVGDAGTTKDFVTGHGITEALLGAEALAVAIVDGSEAAMQRYWQQRDEQTLPLFLNARWMGETRFNDAFTQSLFEQLSTQAGSGNAIAELNDRRRSPFDLFTPASVRRAITSAVLRGRFEVLPAFWRVARRLRREQRFCRHDGTAPWSRKIAPHVELDGLASLRTYGERS